MTTAIQWLVFDVGNTLVNDDPTMVLAYRTLYEKIHLSGSGPTFGDLMQERERLIVEESVGKPWAALAAAYLGPGGWEVVRQVIFKELERDYFRYNQPFAGVAETLALLASRYRLAIAANQAKSCRGALQKAGWSRYFSDMQISEEVGFGKPRARFFTQLLERIECPPDRAVMIGDRIDYDIRPAKALGMKAVQVKIPASPPATFDSDEERLYYESVGRVRVGADEPHSAVDIPDAIVRAFDEIPSVVGSLQS